MSFRDVLLDEIGKQRKLQDRMGDFHESTQGNGIMGQIRAERLSLLTKLLDFEPCPANGGRKPWECQFCKNVFMQPETYYCINCARCPHGVRSPHECREGCQSDAAVRQGPATNDGASKG